MDDSPKDPKITGLPNCSFAESDRFASRRSTLRTNNFLKKWTAKAAVTAALGFASASASAVPYVDFTVDPSSHGGPAAFVADKITGNYVQVITFTPTSVAGGTFASSLKWQAGQFVANDGTAPLPGITTGLGISYGLYALHRAIGTFTFNAGGGATFVYDAGVGSFSMGIDGYAGLTTFTEPTSGAAAWVLGNNGDDTEVATGVPDRGAGQLIPSLPTCDPGINCGSFGASTSFALKAAGMGFFVAPIPFYNTSFQSGQLNNFSVSGTQTINGSLDVIFAGGQPPPVSDSDGDGVPDGDDNCPDTASGDPVDANGCSAAQLDTDNDGVSDANDYCANTVIPESVPSRSLGVNRFALVDGDDVFDTKSPKGKGPRRSYTTADTAGCSCTQIIEAQGLGKGHTKFGCSISAMDDWVNLVTP
jgi:hypothetical protein